MGISRTISKSNIKSIQRGTLTLDATNTATATITAVDTTKSVLLVSGTGIINSGTTPLAARTFQAVFLSDTQVRITAQQGSGTTTTGTAAWQVIEYN